MNNNGRKLTRTELVFIELDRQKSNEIKAFYEEYENARQALVDEHGLGHHFQDEEGVVYEINEAKGKFIPFDKYEVKRTRRLSIDEIKGSLSMKYARELNYEVEGKR